MVKVDVLRQKLDFSTYGALYSSIDEEEHETSVGPSGGLEGETKRMTLAQSVPVAKSNVTDRADDWFNDEDVPGEQPYEVESGTVELATPEEIR